MDLSAIQEMIESVVDAKCSQLIKKLEEQDQTIMQMAEKLNDLIISHQAPKGSVSTPQGKKPVQMDHRVEDDEAKYLGD